MCVGLHLKQASKGNIFRVAVVAVSLASPKCILGFGLVVKHALGLPVGFFILTASGFKIQV